MNSSMQNGTRKNNMAIEHEPGRKTDEKRNDECGNIWFESNKFQVEHLLIQYIVIRDEKNENVNKRIESPAGGITKSLY